MKKIYLDANIYYNLWLRESKNGIPLDYYVEKLMSKIIREKFVLVISNTLVNEVERKYEFMKEQLTQLTEKLSKNNKLIYQMADHELAKEAMDKVEHYKKQRIKTHFSDVIQILIAKKENAVFITNDKEAREIAIEEGLEVTDLENFLD